MTFYTPLRYPGGKGKLAKTIKQILFLNKLNGGVYIEPYAGGAAIGLMLLINNIVESIVINDLDYVIYAFWRTLQENSSWLCKNIENARVDIDEWYNQKEINSNPEKYNIYEVGYSTFFMNRTNRSGIIKGGVIGGKNQNGPYKIDCRFNKNDLIERINRITLYKDRIHIYNKDAMELLNCIDLKGKLLIYFDPPYYNKSNKLYRNSYTDDDHIYQKEFNL